MSLVDLTNPLPGVVWNREWWHTPILPYYPHSPYPYPDVAPLIIPEITNVPTTEYSELELKFDADHLQISDFVEWVKRNYNPSKHIRVMGRDDYYSQGENVIRHRFPADGPGEITVKCRKDPNSITNRVEVDLPLDPKATVPDVQRFMHYSGWKLEVSLFKYAEIFHIKDSIKPEVTLVIYDISHIPTAGETAKAPHRFIEIEVEKNPAVSEFVGLSHLNTWKTTLINAFKLTEPLNRSLYEIYTQNHYKVVNATDDNQG